MPASAGPATALVTPGTTSKEMPAARNAAISSPARRVNRGEVEAEFTPPAMINAIHW